MHFGREEIERLTESIWGTVLGWQALPCPEGERPCDGEAFLTGSVPISGTWEGEVHLTCAEALARQAAAVLFDLDEHEVAGPLVHDALGELSNMTAGNLKALLPEPCTLGLPTVSRGAGEALQPLDGHTLLLASFRCRELSLRVAVTGKGNRTAEDLA